MEQRISSLTVGQAAYLLIAITMGSSIVYVPGAIAGLAGNGAWISMAGAWAFGTAMLACILYLHRSHGGAGLIECCTQLLGKKLGGLALLVVASMLLFSIPAILTGIGDFFSRGMMPRTPAFIFCALSMLISAATARAGVKAMARMFVLLVPVMIGFTSIVLVFACPMYDAGRLLPIADQGAGGWLKGLFSAAGFPFGEVVFFAALLHSSSKEERKRLHSRLHLAFALTGALMLLSTICTIMAFGPAAGQLTYSLYQMASNIILSGINERVEAVIGIALILGSYMKATIYLYILNRIVVAVTLGGVGKTGNTGSGGEAGKAGQVGNVGEKAFVSPIALLCVLLSVTLFESPADFQRQVYQIWPFTVIAIGCTLIVALCALTWLKARLRDKPELSQRSKQRMSEGGTA